MENKELQNTGDFKHVVNLISTAQNKVYKAVNEELVLLYWEVGAYVSNKVSSGAWGDNIVVELASYIQAHYPSLKGFTKRGLYRMKQFHETYHGIENVSTLLTHLSWSNHLMILSKCKTIEEKQFYILYSAKEKWSNRELKRQIESSVFERTILADSNVSPVVTQIQEDVSKVFKDTYVFEFLDLPVNHNERDLQHQLLANLKKFLLELGGGFSFIGEEYRVQVGMHDYYIDLLFFHRELQCLVAIELKTTEFQPEHLGKLNFYLEALDSEVKMPNENPSIGILLCKGKDSEVVEFALRRNVSPAVIADYETKLIDKKLLQQKMHDLYLLFDQNQEEK